VLDAVGGGAESSEYLRQNTAIVEAWSADGVDARYEAIPDANHFTIIAPLADANSAMCARILELTARL
jgi:arylformamidase